MARKCFLLTAAILFFTELAIPQAAKTRLAVVGLDHDHVWGLLRDIQQEPDAELIAIADPHPELVERARKRVPPSVQFFSDYVKMLDEAKPEAVIVATENDKHLEILRECAKRHIHFSTEKPLASTAADAREMARLAQDAQIKLMEETGLVGTAKYWLWLSEGGGELTRFRVAAIGAEVLLGFLTFSGSLMAAGKLQEVLPQRPITYKGQNFVNLGLLAVAVIIAAYLVHNPGATHLYPVMVGIALVFGSMV